MSPVLMLDAATDPGACGHKAATLAALRHQGFDVPDGFVIPAGAHATRDEIAQALARLGAGPVAVRSSGLAEDLADASFAGQYDTLLNVEGAEAVLQAAAACVASGHNQRVAAYGHAAGAVAVLVQRMVDAEMAGVAFSANPLTGNRDEARVSAARGLGDRLVSGAVDGDEWIVTGDRVSAASPAGRVIGPDLARRVAALARKAEAVRGQPQDIEWAVAGGRLWLLQSRPITALPVAPEITIPKGTWQKDAGHFFDPISPFAVSTQLREGDQMLDEAIATWGLMPDRIRFAVIGHEPYIHVEPDDGGKNPPPWWVLGAVVRVIPSLRRKLATSARAVNGGLLESVPREWETSTRPRLREEIARLAAIDLATLDDAALFQHVDALSAFYAKSLRHHFSLAIPTAVGLYELTTTCEQLLGWDMAKAMGLLQGLSSVSTAPTEELAAIARRAALRPATRDLLQARRPDVLDRLDEVDPAAAGELRAYLRFWGLRPLGPEVGSPLVAERPQLIADLLAESLDDHSTAQQVQARSRAALVDEARSRLSGAARGRFDAALRYAELIYPLREDNVLLTDQLPVGLLRLAALEAGRRLVSAGRLDRADEAVMLTADELREALTTSREVRTLVARRKAEQAWVRANPGPMIYGPPPGKTPDLRGLPEPARRINEGLLWALEHEISAPPVSEGGILKGAGASPGTYRGRVRVIRTADQVETLRAGEVLVCPATSAAWMLVFRRAGALVADTGSVLSHTAIVAREFGLPAVVAVGNATTTFVDGEEVVVDGTHGTVTRVASSASRAAAEVVVA
ncbi:MAG: PEP/pyruvate-binding domain-containing protein [Vicinamibacterales bacterium]